MNKELIEKIISYNYNEYGAEFGDALVDLKHENEWLHHIIKEAKEYIEMIVKNTPSSMRKDYANMLLIDYKKLLEILDKGE